MNAAPAPKPGKLVTFEGPEGGGNSTQAAILAGKLRGIGLSVVTTREPGGTPTGEIIRDLLQNDLAREPLCDAAEALLFCASRAQLCRNVLAPALARGEWIVLDRFTDSTLAYQGYGRGFDIGTLRAMNDFATGETRPALTILLDIPAEAGLARAFARSGGGDRIESAPLKFHRRLREGYLALARGEPERFAVVDATATPDAVADAVWQAVKDRLLGGVC
ncbi:MAG: dTMP kinase [Kiritimatiellae bacterium]|nr:dTMP kinase [Kiritimatiellia bacterium]